MYDIHGKYVGSFSFVPDVRDSGILQVASWPNGLALLTNEFKLYVINSFHSPFCEQFARIPVVLDFDDENEIGMAVLSDDGSGDGGGGVIGGGGGSADGSNSGSGGASGTGSSGGGDTGSSSSSGGGGVHYHSIIEVIVSVPQSNSVFVVTKDRCMDMKVENGPFPRIVASPSAGAIALFTESGGLWAIPSDFSENTAEFNTKSSAPPHQVAWCGEDSVCLYWEPDQINREGTSLLLMIGPSGEFQKFTFDGPIHLSTEIDGVRIITNHTCEFLQRVPEPIFDIFRIGSLTPSAMLYDAFVEFEKKNASSIKNIRSIKSQLPNAVRNCLAAASHEYNPQLQRALLRAATYGKSFCDDFNHGDFMNTCKVLRVMNAVRDYNIGIPITFEQYKKLTPNVLIDRLVTRCHHLLAYRICEYLKIKPANVLVHWACSKVRSEEDEAQILKSIKSKLKICEGVSYATIASVAHRAGRKNLAISLLEKEERSGEQVPLLLNMGETKKALRQAIYSGETDLVYLVLLHMKKKLEPAIFFSIINEKEFDVARNLFVSYCREQDIEFLKVFYQALELPHEAALMTVYESYQIDDEDIPARRKLLSQANALFAKRRDMSAEARSTEQQKTLLAIQSKLDESIGRRLFTGLSVTDTIYNCILMGDRTEEKIKADFGVPDKRYWWIKIAAYSKLGEWDKLESFARKKSPIGYKPFAEACIRRGNQIEAIKYIPRVSDPWEKVELYVELSKFKEAIETAYAQQDIDMLSFIQSKTTNAKTKQTIEELMAKLGA